MKDIEQQAQAIIVRARQQADQLLAQAQIEGEHLRQQAKAQGLAEGRREGIAKGTEEGRKSGHQQALDEHRAELESLIATLTRCVQELEGSRRELEAAAASDVVRLAVAIARRVTKLHGAASGDVLIENIREAMKMVIHASDIRISVHPEQREELFEALPQLKLQWPALAHIELIEDATLSPGGCRIFAGQGFVDADLDNQIDRIAADLLPATQEAP